MNRLAALAALAVVCGITLFPGPARAGGIFFGLALDGFPVTPEMIRRAAGETGLSPQMIVFFLQWPAPGGEGDFPLASLEAIEKAGAMPCLTWEPMHIDPDGRETMADYRDVLAGNYDPDRKSVV